MECSRAVVTVWNETGPSIGHTTHLPILDVWLAIGHLYFDVRNPAEGIESMPTVGQFATQPEAEARVREWWAEGERTDWEAAKRVSAGRFRS